jgi:multidrug efflux pump subunit AcrA (membrane-fusion protein)
MSGAKMSYSHLQPHYRLLLDVFFAAVFLTIVGLTIFVVFQVPSNTRFPAYQNPMIGLPHPFPIPILVGADGRIERSYLNEGMHVYRGDVLVQMDTGHLQEKKSSLEQRIHSAEHDRKPTLALYSELEETRIALLQRTITSPQQGRIIAIAPVKSGDEVRRGTAVAVQVIESQHAHHPVWPAVHR